MSNIKSHRKLSDTLTLTEDNRGWWLWDETRGMNLAMYEKTAEQAFVKALEYYQERLTEVENEYKSLKGNVDTFVSQIIKDEDNED